MAKNKLFPAKVILVLIILISFGMVMGVSAYLLKLKKPLPVAIQPTVKPTTIPKSDCSPTVTDIDGNTYKTVKIGSQCWLKQNLKVTKDPQGKPITRYCYNNDSKTCDTDGGLYDWNTAMNNSTKEGAQGICPDGWHVPKDSEWYTLEEGLIGNSCDVNRIGWGCDSIGANLKQGGSSGFDAILIGNRAANPYSPNLFYGKDKLVFIWSSTEVGPPFAWIRSLNSSYASTDLRDAADKKFGFSMRCLKD